MDIIKNSVNPVLSMNLSKMNFEQLSFVTELNRQLTMYRFSLEEALKHNKSLIQFDSCLNQLQEPHGEKGTSVKHINSVTQMNQVKQEYHQVSSSQSIVEDKKRVKRRYKKRLNKDEQNDINETKNIPKNFGKAILSFIHRNISTYKDLLTPILSDKNMTIVDLITFIKKHKRSINSINYLKYIWGYRVQKQNPIFKCIRILSFVFLRKFCLPYVFNSRVKNFMTHVKYRARMIEGLLNPEQFTCIKQF